MARAKPTHWHVKMSDRLINGPVLQDQRHATAEAAIADWERTARAIRADGEEILSHGNKGLPLGDPWVGCFGMGTTVGGRAERVVRWVYAFGCDENH